MSERCWDLDLECETRGCDKLGVGCTEDGEWLCDECLEDYFDHCAEVDAGRYGWGDDYDE